MTADAPDPNEVARAVATLERAVAAAIAARPEARWARPARPGERVELRLQLALDGGRPDPAGPAGAATAIQDAARQHLERSVVLRPNRVVDLRDGSIDGPGSAPRSSREIFVGWTPHGAPRFEELGPWLIARGDPRQDLLYRKPPQLVVEGLDRGDLAGDLLPGFDDATEPWRVEGQVMAGYWRVPRFDTGAPESLALTFQAVSLAAGSGRRWALQTLGVGPGGEPLEELADRLASGRGTLAPWHEAATWASTALATLDGPKKGGRGGAGGPNAPTRRRVGGILSGLARRLEQTARGRARRTGHAETRHRQGDRPTRQAMADLERAAVEDAFVDRRYETYVVLGDRGRAHVWGEDGRLVTSLRSSPEATERKRRQEIWRPATPRELATLRSAVEAASARAVASND